MGMNSAPKPRPTMAMRIFFSAAMTFLRDQVFVDESWSKISPSRSKGKHVTRRFLYDGGRCQFQKPSHASTPAKFLTAGGTPRSRWRFSVTVAPAVVLLFLPAPAPVD